MFIKWVKVPWSITRKINSSSLWQGYASLEKYISVAIVRGCAQPLDKGWGSADFSILRIKSGFKTYSDHFARPCCSLNDLKTNYARFSKVRLNIQHINWQINQSVIIDRSLYVSNTISIVSKVVLRTYSTTFEKHHNFYSTNAECISKQWVIVGESLQCNYMEPRLRNDMLLLPAI